MTNDSVKQRHQVEVQVEQWIAEAKRLNDAGREVAALDLYRRAADELPGAPWLQHRTGEIARKLKRNDIAIHYYRRAATAFQIADFRKRAVAPLRTAWILAIEGLPVTSRQLVDTAVELVHLYRGLGFAADATVTLERTNTVLRNRGFSEVSPSLAEVAPANSPPPSARAPQPSHVAEARPSAYPSAASPSSHSEVVSRVALGGAAGALAGLARR